MTEELRPRRSVLYVPGDNERALEKASGLPADVVVLDLEDAVPPAAKAAARDRLRDIVGERRFGQREVLVRANGLGTAWFEEDVTAIVAAGADGVLVPKVSSAAQVHAVEAALQRAGASERTRIWVMMETAAAVLEAAAISDASPRLVGLVMGTNDLAKELRVAHLPDRRPLMSSLSWCVLAARAAGKVIIDAVFNDLGDMDGFERECRQARDHGFDGKSAIHPKQLEPCNRVFAPDAEEVAEARKLIQAFDEADQSRGVVLVDGRMVERLHVDQARRTLAVADAIAGTEGAPPGVAS